MSVTPAPHDCVKSINALLAPSNTMLSQVISLGSSTRELILLATSKADDKVRQKPAIFFASYCPMCGIKLEK